MHELTISQIDAVSGAVSDDAASGSALGVAWLAVGHVVTAPSWGTASILGGTTASGVALYAAY